MRCNNLGHADPNGGYELIDGKPVLRDATKARMWQPGDYIGFDMAFLDSAAAPASGPRISFADGSQTFTDAERSFLDSVEGREQIAHAASCHQLREAHKGAKARPFDGYVRDAAIRNILIARNGYQSLTQRMMAQNPALQAAHDTAVYLRKRRNQY